MFNAEIRQMLAQVITSWQVIAVTIVIILFISIVNKVARLHTMGVRYSRPKKIKSKKNKTEIPPPSDSDDLGIEEESSDEVEEEFVE